MIEKYRKNALGVIYRESDKKVLVFSNGSWGVSNAWQFPQGGVDAGEDIVNAAYREIFEETGIKSIELVAKLEEPYKYLIPDEFNKKIIEEFGSLKFLGQEQYWHLFKFTGSESEIDLTKEGEGFHSEFDKYKWVDIDEVVDQVIYFKIDIYKKAISQIKKFM